MSQLVKRPARLDALGLATASETSHCTFVHVQGALECWFSRGACAAPFGFVQPFKDKLRRWLKSLAEVVLPSEPTRSMAEHQLQIQRPPWTGRLRESITRLMVDLSLP
jgi:hypothetical protein